MAEKRGSQRVQWVTAPRKPATSVAGAREQIDRIGGRAFFAPKVAVITGAGPVGLLAAPRRLAGADLQIFTIIDRLAVIAHDHQRR
jgi:threonine dehydrogenase-like Zn-dependent dehydrogenase